jgi:hypothetical protein
MEKIATAQTITKSYITLRIESDHDIPILYFCYQLWGAGGLYQIREISKGGRPIQLKHWKWPRVIAF